MVHGYKDFRIVRDRLIMMRQIHRRQLKAKIFVILLLCVLFNSCKTLELGDKMPESMSKENDNYSEYTLLNSSTIVPLYKYSEYVSIGGLNGEIEFIGDENPNRVIDGLRIGDKIEYGSELFKKVHVELGVCYYIPLSNNWNAYIGEINEKETDLKVLFFFKKKMSLETGFYKTYDEYQEWLSTLEFPEEDYELDERKIIIVPVQ